MKQPPPKKKTKKNNPPQKKTLTIVPCAMSNLSWKFHETPFIFVYNMANRCVKSPQKVERNKFCIQVVWE